MSDHERDKTMIQELLELKSKVDRIIRESFQNQSKFYDVVRVSACGRRVVVVVETTPELHTHVTHAHTQHTHEYMRMLL